MQAHSLGEVGILGKALLRVYSETLLQTFIEIGSYLTDREQKISWHSFFETRCTMIMNQELADAPAYAPGRRFVCAHQMAALFCLK